ncbi:hypothetical protein AURDEDRAFT_127382 [Auricularia subglabra TFB-10046 SS5]|uniref:Uncharacterized protein n=1 Tax=Auricularia subglabra (strain TFB-10046 / SS5) TaxID=717982 RepID=J0D2M9_AURST|nr:hypothetical protein AURDEDRAFT_127382 [Auricularia subglabra TFB-10046 SS5]
MSAPSNVPSTTPPSALAGTTNSAAAATPERTLSPPITTQTAANCAENGVNASTWRRGVPATQRDGDLENPMFMSTMRRTLNPHVLRERLEKFKHGLSEQQSTAIDEAVKARGGKDARLAQLNATKALLVINKIGFNTGYNPKAGRARKSDGEWLRGVRTTTRDTEKMADHCLLHSAAAQEGRSNMRVPAHATNASSAAHERYGDQERVWQRERACNLA